LLVLAASANTALVTTWQATKLTGLLPNWSTHIRSDVISDVDFVRLAYVVGSITFLQVSANNAVRLLLAMTGQRILIEVGEDVFKGGRVLGALERTLIFGLGIAGELTAASVVIAAKSLLRLPEIPGRGPKEAEDNLAMEYLIVGTLGSWLLALLLVPLASSGT
jgi:hypothetical protein